MSTITVNSSTALRGPLDFPDSPLSQAAKQPLMLGLFLPIQTGGFSQSTYPRGTDWSFEYNRALALRAEAHGFEFAFGLQQWVPKGGFGGASHYRENFLDPFMATVALSALTRRLITISTVHILYGDLHPLHLARFAAMADHISGGKFGLDIVTGYDAAEPLMFGMKRIAHDERYDRADEFVSVMEWWGAAARISRTTGGSTNWRAPMFRRGRVTGGRSWCPRARRRPATNTRRNTRTSCSRRAPPTRCSNV